MLNAIDRPGTFRGNFVEHGVSKTTNGYPQFVGKLKALEYYNEETGEWMSWTEFDQEITAYLCLYTKDKQSGAWKELQNATQLKKALGWDGASFSTLANGNYANTMVLFRVEEDEYNGNVKLKVSWVDTHDANPLRQLVAFDTDKLKTLDTEFTGVLSGPAPVPAKPAGAPATPPRRGRPPKATPTPGAVTPPKASVPSVPEKATAPVSAPAPTLPLSPTAMTKDEAWLYVNQEPLGVDETKLAEVWITEVTKIGKPEDKFSPAEWALVASTVRTLTAKF